MNLELDVLNTDCLPDIIVRPYEYSYEELVDIINEQDDELMLLEFNKFCDEFEQGLDRYTNILVLNDYINNHGVDQAVEELFGTEGLLEGVKNAVVSFVKWLWKQLTNLVQWIKKLFSKSENLPAPTEADLEHPDVFVRKSTSSKPNINAANKILKKLSLDMSYKDKISIPVGIEGVSDIAKKLETELSTTTYSWDLAKKLLDTIPDIQRYLGQDDEKTVSRDVAAECYIRASVLTFQVRSYALGILHVLTELLKTPIKPNMTNEEAVSCVNKFKNALKIGSDDKSLNTDNIKEYIAALRKTCGVAIRCSNVFRKWGIKIVSQFTYGLDGGVGYVTTLSDLISSKFAGVDVEVAVPQSIQKKLNDAWKRKFRIQRVIITNVRGAAGISGKIGVVGANQAHIGLPNVEVTMSAFLFAEKLNLNRLVQVARRSGAPDGDVVRQIVESDGNRVELFMKFLVHELRHTWQSQTGFKYGKVIMPGVNGTQKEYEESEHEVDARTAADNYKVDDTDRNWVRSILGKMLAQARKNRNKYKSK